VFSGELRQERLPTALAAAAWTRAASLTRTAGAAGLSRSIAVALTLRAAAVARTTLSPEPWLTRLGLPVGIAGLAMTAAVALPVA
jgi:hypothetical protein